MFMFFILANEEGANSPVDYLPLRSGLVSTAREEMIWVRTAPISFLVNRLALASNLSFRSHGIILMPYEFSGGSKMMPY